MKFDLLRKEKDSSKFIQTTTEHRLYFYRKSTEQKLFGHFIHVLTLSCNHFWGWFLDNWLENVFNTGRGGANYQSYKSVTILLQLTQSNMEQRLLLMPYLFWKHLKNRTTLVYIIARYCSDWALLPKVNDSHQNARQITALSTKRIFNFFFASLLWDLFARRQAT